MKKAYNLKNIIIVSVITAVILVIFPYILYTSSQKVVKPLSAPQVVILPSEIMQGDPVMIRVDNVFKPIFVKEILFADKSVNFFNYKAKPTAIIPIDLNAKTGDYNVQVKLSNDVVLNSKITVLARYKPQAVLGIPAKLGGNSTTSQQNLINNLSKENAAIKALPIINESLWNEPFEYPLDHPIISDPFGYTRLTGDYTISHLGTDFAADEGTPVAAMNKGVVSFADTTTVYGKMVVINHGLGIDTLYLHLSKINVTKGQIVEKGQVIGLSGQTGYAEKPHLHISVKINNISIDPIKFLNFFN